MQDSNRKLQPAHQHKAANQAPWVRSADDIATQFVEQLARTALNRAILAEMSPEERLHEVTDLYALDHTVFELLLRQAVLLVERIRAHTTAAWGAYQSHRRALHYLSGDTSEFDTDISSSASNASINGHEIEERANAGPPLRRSRRLQGQSPESQ